MLEAPWGLTPIEIDVTRIAMGAGKPVSYQAMGMMISSLVGWTVNVKDFHPRFIKCCSKGLVTFIDWKQLSRGVMDRLIDITPHGVQSIRDLSILEGGDYGFYRNFDPFLDYSKDPHALDRFSVQDRPLVIDGAAKRKRTKREKWAPFLQQARANPGKYFFFGKTAR